MKTVLGLSFVVVVALATGCGGDDDDAGLLHPGEESGSEPGPFEEAEGDLPACTELDLTGQDVDELGHNEFDTAEGYAQGEFACTNAEDVDVRASGRQCDDGRWLWDVTTSDESFFLGYGGETWESGDFMAYSVALTDCIP